MKTIKILLACVIVLLGVGIYLLIENGKQTPAPETSDMMEMGMEYFTGSTDNGTPVKESEKMALCKACNGIGYDPLDVNGRRCSVCDGKGFMPESEMLRRYEEWRKEEITCFYCGGTGNSDTTPLIDMDMIAPQGTYKCKVCNGNKKGTRAELLENFKIAQEVYGTAL